MTLPLEPPLKPQLALSRKELPVGEQYRYEIKLDGFRCLAFVDGGESFLQSRNGRPLSRYFPELTLPAGELRARRRDRGARRGRARGLRCAGPAHPSGRVADRTPGRRDARPCSWPSTCSHEDGEVLLERSYDERRGALEALLAGSSSPARRSS